jgi:hypothetical protein
MSVCYIEIARPVSFTKIDVEKVLPGLGTHYYEGARNFFELFCRTLICRPDLIESLWNRKNEEKN